ncbi:MAG: aminotransferase class I/II-fold pyridoxal phosphate-dependent enzyme [Rickettsiales bacterium]|nr:aminotransferase class I/II-fold pyridoxal phosphate-dependent enzyme [Rickettsiales bacterium]
MKTSKRSNISPFYVMEAFTQAEEIAKTGADVLHLSLGQPSEKPPHRVLEHVAHQAMHNPLGYTLSAGMDSLRERIAQHYADAYGIDVPYQRVFITIGSSSAYMMALLAAFDEGDEVALVAPHYPASPNMMRALGLKPVIMRSRMEDNYQPTRAMLEALPNKPQGLVIASPSNPAGTIIDPVELQAVAEYCAKHGIRIISDEIYHGVSYGDTPTDCILKHSHEMIVTNSFSKYYLLPGWRLGWAIMPEDLCRNVESLLQNFYISPSTLSQIAALAVLDCTDELDQVVQGYKQNRDCLLQGLQNAGMTRVAPAQGAFYLYADVSELTDDSKQFCKDMLEKTHICAVPGIDFDAEFGHKFVRFSYAGSLETMEKASERLARWLHN